MAKLPDGWVYIPKWKDRDIMTVEVEQRELVCCKRCTHWTPGGYDEKSDSLIPPRCEWHGGGWSADEWCCHGNTGRDNQ